MIEITFRYMPRLETFEVPPARCAIRPTWTKAFTLLRSELAKLNAQSVVVEAGYKPGQVRSDGWPYSNARASHPDVRISFVAGGQPLSFASGGWASVEGNVYLIALTLESLRAVERYCCTKSGQQYRGWARLPEGRAAIEVAEWPNVEAAVRFLCDVAGWITPPPVPANIATVFRDAVKKSHPDAGGNAETMARVNRARDYIERGVK